MDSTEVPEKMKAALASSYGDACDVLKVSGTAAPPAPSKNQVTIRVHACSLSPSDYRMLSGSASLVKKPKEWPYIPGGDVSGTIVGTHESESHFRIGQRVMATWDSFGMGGLAEFKNVETKYVHALPDHMSYVDGAGIVDSSANALLATQDAGLSEKDQVLVLGGSGAVGTAVLQLARWIGCKVIVTTSTDEGLCKGLGATDVVDYTREAWWESEAVKRHAPFDVVIDCAEGVSAWRRVCEDRLVKKGWGAGGRFVAVVVNEWDIPCKTVMDLGSFLGRMIGRTITSRMCSWKQAKYRMLFPAPRGDEVKKLLEIEKEGGLRVVIDRGRTLRLTTDGVREAFDIMVSRRAHGKVIIEL